MNENFINIKIDREERPDVDRLYMQYLLAMGKGGVWPLSVCERFHPIHQFRKSADICTVLTPTLEPFFAGTYFPPKQFRALLERVADLWEDDRDQCEKLGRDVIASMKEMGAESVSPSAQFRSITSLTP